MLHRIAIALAAAPERQGRDHRDHLSANLIPPRGAALGERRESGSTHPHLN